MELCCAIQNYEWGKRGCASEVANLYRNVNEDVVIECDTPYAELWMGTHVNGPSVLKKSKEPLLSVLDKHPEYLGEDVILQFGHQLPFLFKVLSINKPLSIQAHPSKELAEKLHSKHPDVYKDSNHKPELAIALTPFEALCGFREVDQIKSYLDDVPELKNLVGTIKACASEEDFLKHSFYNLFDSPKDIYQKELKRLLRRLKTLDTLQRQNQLADLVERLHDDFPGDIGCFVVYFLNYMELKPSQAMFLAAGEPHAYLSGDCVECMACSDNVVRAGLTPKYIDVKTLCSMLIYKGGSPNDKIFKPIMEDNNTLIYKPPVIDFAVAQIKVPVTTTGYKMIERTSASILIVVTGNGRTDTVTLIPGTVLFIPANTRIEIKSVQEVLVLYQALVNL